MKKRFYISEVYCAGYLATGYAVATEAEAMEHFDKVKAFNEPNACIKVEEQIRPWYSNTWRTVRTVAEWWN